MKKKIIIIFIILVAIFFAYYISKGSRFQKTNIFENKAGKADDNSNNTNTTDQDNNGGSGTSYVAPNIEVKPADCDKDCSRFTKDNEKEYCQEICGTTTFFEDAAEEGGSSDDCADEKGIQKDYCLKDIAVGNKDQKICDQIQDANIKKTCKNRIMEDILEEQRPDPEL
ncbi:MAG: hypothetical protein WCV59_04825 [Parcubacteria group bacterium]|jgi:hypothetical protein